MYDERGTEYYGDFDGITYANAGTDAIHTSTYLKLRVRYNFPTNAANQMMMSKYTAGVGGFYIQQSLNGGLIRFAAYDSTGALESFTLPDTTGFDIWKDLELEFNAGVVTWTYNGVSGNHTMTNTTLGFGTGFLYISGAQKCIGLISYVSIGTLIFDFQNNSGTTTIENIGTGSDATLVGATLPDFWNNSNGQLVESNCVTLDGVAVLDYGFAPVTGQTFFDLECYIKKSNGESISIVNNDSLPNKLGFVWYTDDDLYFVVGDGGTDYIKTTPDIAYLDNFIKVRVIYNGSLTLVERSKIYINDVEQVSTMTGIVPPAYNGIPTKNFTTGIYDTAGDIGNITGVTFRDINGDIINQFKLSEGNGSTAYNRTGLNATWINATYPDLYAESQDSYHPNYRDGHDQWRNVTGDIIRVPIGTTVVEAGYTFYSTNPPKRGLNGCETKVKFPIAITGAYAYIPDPLGYEEFENDFNANHEVYSNTADKNHGNIMFYSTSLTAEEDLKLTKCMIKNDANIEIMTDPSGVELTDPAGYVLVIEGV